MSFIYQDKNLTAELIKAGISSLEKYGANENPAVYGLANKLVIDLQRTIDPDKAPAQSAPISSPNGETNLNAEQLRNLGDFINWAANSKLEWKGKRFAWTAQERLANPGTIPNEAAEFSAYTTTRERDGSRKPNEVAAYALKPELLAFVTYLRDSEENRKNRVLQVMIGSLINQINSNLEPGEAKLEKKPSPKGTTSEINPNMIVDALPDVLDAKHPFEGITDWNASRLKLPVSVISNNDSFKKWILLLNIKDDEGVQSAVFDPEKGDRCLAVHLLYKRAQYLVGLGTIHDEETPGYSKAAKLYLDKVLEIGKTFTGKDGKPCSVTSSGSGAGTASSSGGKTTLTPQQLALLGEAVYKLPLAPTDIDMGRIDTFLDALAKFDQGTRTGELVHHIAYREIPKIMAANKALMIGDYPQINLTQNLQSIMGLLKGNDIMDQRKGISAYLDNLRQLIIQTSAMVSALNSTWGYALSPAQKEKVSQQINYYANDNMAKINRLASQLSQATK